MYLLNIESSLVLYSVTTGGLVNRIRAVRCSSPLPPVP
jgi:hypothetical protein